MGERYLIDSNIIIDYTASRIPEKGSDFVEELFDTSFLISIITKIEVLGFDDIASKTEAMEEFLRKAVDLPLNEDVTKQTILLRKNHKKIKLPDAIIAATAIVNDLILATNNMKDFDKIENLKLFNPYSL